MFFLSNFSAFSYHGAGTCCGIISYFSMMINNNLRPFFAFICTHIRIFGSQCFLPSCFLCLFSIVLALGIIPIVSSAHTYITFAHTHQYKDGLFPAFVLNIECVYTVHSVFASIYLTIPWLLSSDTSVTLLLM